MPGADQLATLDPYLFLFILLGGGLVCLIAVVVTDNAVVTDRANRKRTEDSEALPPS